jgi:Rad3-related DNA helicase
MDLLSKLSEKWLERADANKANPGREDAFGDCADELNDALAKLQPVIEKLVDMAEDLRQKAMFNESQRTYNVLDWKAVAFEQKRIADALDAALESWRKLGS